MKIKICPENSDKINEACKMQSARMRLCDYSDVISLAERTEEHLKDFSVPKKSWKGCKVSYSELVYCNSYGSYSANATEITIQRGSVAWFLVNACRVSRGTGRSGQEYSFSPTADAVSAMVEKQKDLFSSL